MEKKEKPILTILLEEKLSKENLSLRSAAKQLNVSHSTISRIIQGEPFDLDTLIVICKWLNVNPATIIEDMGNPIDNLSPKISAILQSEPKLANRFEVLVQLIQKGNIPVEVVKEILAFITFKLETSI